MFVNSIYVWNHRRSCHQNVIFHQLRANKLKEVLIIFLKSKYNKQNLQTVYFYTEYTCFEAYLGLFSLFWLCYNGIVHCHTQSFCLIHR